MRDSAGFGAHTENTECWRVININRRFSHLAHGFADFRKIVIAEVTGPNVPAVNTSGISQHAVD